MTTHKTCICKDCGTVYNFQGSGWGCDEELNDPDWCPDCTKLINEVRKNIKRKFEWRWKESNEYTLDQLFKIEQESIKNHAAIRKVFPCLFDNNDTNNNNNIIRTVKTLDGEFMYNYWTNEPEKAKIYKEVYWDIEKNQMHTYQPRK
jgi:hypothetical protein